VLAVRAVTTSPTLLAHSMGGRRAATAFALSPFTRCEPRLCTSFFNFAAAKNPGGTRCTSRLFGSKNDLSSSSSSSEAHTVFSFCYEGTTVKDTLESSIRVLEASEVDEPVASVTNVLAVVLDLPWETGYRDLQQQPLTTTLAHRRLTREEATEFSDKMQRRLRHEPIQYLTGKWDFLEYTLTIRPPLLCPRPETEELVQLVLQDLPSLSITQPVRILDVGCGTGCIGIALAHQGAQVTAIDIEPVAVETSWENAQAVLDHPERCYRVLLCAAENFTVPEQMLFDFVVSNPPYIPVRDLAGLEPQVLEYESSTALSDGWSEDGMDVIRTIVNQLPSLVHPDGICWMEVDPSHPQLLQEWLSDNDKVDFVSSHKDMFGRDRFVKLQVRNQK
jgi:release factor glutamine methyltransferase